MRGKAKAAAQDSHAQAAREVSWRGTKPTLKPGREKGSGKARSCREELCCGSTCLRVKESPAATPIVVTGRERGRERGIKGPAVDCDQIFKRFSDQYKAMRLYCMSSYQVKNAINTLFHVYFFVLSNYYI